MFIFLCVAANPSLIVLLFHFGPSQSAAVEIFGLNKHKLQIHFLGHVPERRLERIKFANVSAGGPSDCLHEVGEVINEAPQTNGALKDAEEQRHDDETTAAQ